jgi:hypothetical protein
MERRPALMQTGSRPAVRLLALLVRAQSQTTKQGPPIKTASVAVHRRTNIHRYSSDSQRMTGNLS